LLSLGVFRAPVLSLRVTRGDVGMKSEFDLFMQGICVSLGSGEVAEAIDQRIVREVMRRIQCGAIRPRRRSDSDVLTFRLLHDDEIG
jgi:hypothetical protein